MSVPQYEPCGNMGAIKCAKWLASSTKWFRRALSPTNVESCVEWVVCGYVGNMTSDSVTHQKDC